MVNIRTDKTINYLTIKNKSETSPILFLHGFSGSSRIWNDITTQLNCYTIALDIAGHGKSKFLDIDSYYSLNNWSDELNFILNELEISKIKLCGYSMGGRLAIAFASKYPNKIEKLIIESAHLGLMDNLVKKKRYKEDLLLSKLIEEDISIFAEKWQKMPLFSNQKTRNKIAYLNQQEIRLSQNPLQLSYALRLFSQGKMESYENEFREFNFPILIINGSEDVKYKEIGKQMAKINSKARQHIVPKANHNVHLESPQAFIDLIK